jgi:hypothetical protein
MKYMYISCSKRDMTLEEAMTTIQRRRPQAQPIPPFMEFLQGQDKVFQEKRLEANRPLQEFDSSKAISGNKRVVTGPQPPIEKEEEESRPKRRSYDVAVGPSPLPNLQQKVEVAAPIGPATPPSLATAKQAASVDVAEGLVRSFASTSINRTIITA